MFDLNISGIDRIFLVKMWIWFTRIIENYKNQLILPLSQIKFLGKKLVWLYYLSKEDIRIRNNVKHLGKNPIFNMKTLLFASGAFYN